MQFQLKIFDSSATTLTELSRAFKDCAAVDLIKTDKVLYLQPPSGLDALYLPLAATERWGAKPLVHRSQILTTKESEREKGLPKYIVTGTCLADDDPRGPIPETSLLVSATFQAIRDANQEHGAHIRIVGFWAVDLLRMVDPSDLRMILKNAVPELGLT